MAVDSFLFNKGKMAEARGFLLETGRLSGVISLATNESIERSSIGANLVLISPKSKKNVDAPIYFSSSRQVYESNLLDHKEVANVLLSEKGVIQNEVKFVGEWITPADLENNNYILSPDRYLGSENLTLLEKFNDNHKATSLDNLVEIIRQYPQVHRPRQADYYAASYDW